MHEKAYTDQHLEQGKAWLSNDPYIGFFDGVGKSRSQVVINRRPLFSFWNNGYE